MLILPTKPKKKKRNISLHLSVHNFIPLSSGVLFPGASIEMYEFVTEGSSAMHWLCCFVKDKGCAGIIDFAVFSA